MQKLKTAVFRECISIACMFRFPDIKPTDTLTPCPICKSPTKVLYEIDLEIGYRQIPSNNLSTEVISVFDNIRSVYNVAAMFRTMHGFGLSNVVLGGITPTPTHKNFRKTSLGAEDFIQWVHKNNTFTACERFKSDGCQIISIESCEWSQPVMDINIKDSPEKIVLIVGNEITGIDKDILHISDLVLSIPITGSNKSYNVTTAYGIALFQLFFG